MDDQGRFSWRVDVEWILGTVAVGVGILSGVSSVYAESQATFERLEALEREESRHERAAGRAARTLERLENRSESAVERSEFSERARRRLRDRIAHQVSGWERLQSAAIRRSPSMRPGKGADLQRLLVYVERASLSHRGGAFSALGRLDFRRPEPIGGPHRRAAATVELAQHRASERTTESERDHLVERAKEQNPDELREELAESEKRLEGSLVELIDRETGEDFHRRKGTLIPPVDAEPAQRFGKTKQEHSMTYVRHTGLTYRVDKGTEVRAVADGLVVHAQRFEGYGELVIVDHGDDYHSLYAHLADSIVEEGDEMNRGERLGSTGATGSLDGPKLYFELRSDGEPVDPDPWFVRTE